MALNLAVIAVLFFLLLIGGAVLALMAGSGTTAAVCVGFAAVVAVMDSIASRLRKRKD